MGLSEAEARAACASVRTAAHPYQATGAGWAHDERDGLAKLIADGATGRLLGALVVGHRATDVIHELALALKHGLTVAQLAETVHMHPTFAEAVGLAARAWVEQARNDA